MRPSEPIAPSEEASIQPINSQNMDRMVHAWLGRFTHGISPAALALAWFDWFVHLSLYPGKQAELVEKAWRKWVRFSNYATRAGQSDATPCIEPLPQDTRFDDPEWKEWPFNLISQGFLLQQQWWHNATTGVRGVSTHHQDVVTFVSRQLLDMVSPSNFLWTNPVVLKTTIDEGAQNLAQGAMNMATDWMNAVEGKKPMGGLAFQVGRDVAVTPGKVVFRNRLIELIQYAPVTEKVHPEPVLIIPSWIMKYYILDLSPHNSLVKYLVEQGHTVFMVSWKNPSEQDRDLGMDHYRRLGVMAAIDAVSDVLPEHKIHAAGYCLGGTLLAIAAAAMARDNDTRLHSLALFASEVDFEEPGELALFIDDSQVTFLEDIMWDRGYLDGTQMGGAFRLLNSKDLVWSNMVKTYLMGRRDSLNDLMAWNTDTTRLPYHMHRDYLRSLYLHNDLAEGRYLVEDRPVALSDIRVPIFSVATVKDHVSPWRSVYKIHLLTDTQVSFVLTNGGHNAGIVSEPNHPGRRYQIGMREDKEKYMPPDVWQAAMPFSQGSWWPAWHEWLQARSGKLSAAPAMGAFGKGLPSLGDAPGTYVMQG
jgi:polyhydroxyalkanoate synthase subunit PhaC